VRRARSPIRKRRACSQRTASSQGLAMDQVESTVFTLPAAIVRRAPSRSERHLTRPPVSRIAYEIAARHGAGLAVTSLLT
jgi:hypothetical protein